MRGNNHFDRGNDHVGNTENDQFHNRESEDVYDLYNACNGVMHEGRLDVRKLDDLSQEELEVLDVTRLKGLWEHIASGCAKCEAVIETLNWARGMLRASAEGSRPAGSGFGRKSRRLLV